MENYIIHGHALPILLKDSEMFRLVKALLSQGDSSTSHLTPQVLLVKLPILSARLEWIEARAGCLLQMHGMDKWWNFLGTVTLIRYSNWNLLLLLSSYSSGNLYCAFGADAWLWSSQWIAYTIPLCPTSNHKTGHVASLFAVYLAAYIAWFLPYLANYHSLARAFERVYVIFPFLLLQKPQMKQGTMDQIVCETANIGIIAEPRAAAHNTQSKLLAWKECQAEVWWHTTAFISGRAL